MKEKLVPRSFKIFIAGPFNSKLQLDNYFLADKYENLRKKVSAHLVMENTEKFCFLLESFRNDQKGFENWLANGKQASHELLFSKPQGLTQRDSSIFSVDIKKDISPQSRSFSQLSEYFAEPPKLQNVNLNYHENGIGIFSGVLSVELKKDISYQNKDFINFMETLRNSFTLSPGLSEVINEVDAIVYKTTIREFPELAERNKIIDVEKLYGEKISVPLWGHALGLFPEQKNEGLPFGRSTHNLLIVSHPKGLIDMNRLSDGFVHIGWGISLAAGNRPQEIIQIQNTLKRLQFYWRSMQIFNDIVMDYLERYSQMKDFSLKNINNTMEKMDRLKIESELFTSYQMDYIKMLSPLSHFIFKETSISWRINEMQQFFKNKMRSLSVLHKQGETSIKERIEKKKTEMANRLNILISILALLTLFSWAADSMGFLDETLSLLPALKPFLIGGKFLIIIATPLLVVAITFMFFKIVRKMRDAEAKDPKKP